MDYKDPWAWDTKLITAQRTWYSNNTSWSVRDLMLLDPSPPAPLQKTSVELLTEEIDAICEGARR